MEQQPRMRIGDALLHHELVQQDILDSALDAQRMQGGKIGEILLGRGDVTTQNLARSLATHYALPFVDLIATPPDAALLDEAHYPQYIALQIVPYKREGTHIVLAVADITANMLAWADAMYGRQYRLAITSPRDILKCVQANYNPQLDEESRESLFKQMPTQSAKYLITAQERRRIFFVLCCCFSLGVFFTKAFLVTLITVMNIFFCFTIALKGLLLLHGLLRRPANPPAISDHELPIYSVLVPLYKEAGTLSSLFENLRKLDYPHDRLDIKLVLEATDQETIAAAKALKPEGMFEIIEVPDSLPRTKPKACNYALRFARGEFVTIYDAEDAPHPQQLRLAVARFRSLPNKVACLQARLNYYNAPRNILTKLFAIEYSTWFDFMLPGLERLYIPIPLGGTSNHLRLSVLRELGEWDPYNVTEDADLGVRLAASRYETAMLDSITMEEAPFTLPEWTRQRSRWIKGYMQTWLVHMRSPKKLFDAVGSSGFWGFQFFVGGPCLVFLTAPVLWVVWFLWLGGWWRLPDSAFYWWLGPVVGFNLFLGVLVHGGMAIMALLRWRWGNMLGALLAYPFYWFLHSFAAYKALWQLVFKPHYWEKTTHSGLTGPLFWESTATKQA